jgi:hypothetical protein
VLCHAEGTAGLAASVFDSEYVAFCRRHLGDAESRTLGEDARALSALAAGHSELARVNACAWLFRTLERAVAAAPIELAKLSAEDVDEPLLLPLLRTRPEAIEILRCAAELERPFHARLPPPVVDFGAVRAELANVTRAAPRLATSDVVLVRSLRLRGRVRGDEIWVGAPDPTLGPSVEHVAWQAAHEATVVEVSAAGRLGERQVEHAAVALLAARAERSALRAAHARWLAHFGKNAPSIARESLPAHAQKLVDDMLRDQ